MSYNNVILNVSSYLLNSDQYEDDYGIITEHAYTLIKAVEI